MNQIEWKLWKNFSIQSNSRKNPGKNSSYREKKTDTKQFPKRNFYFQIFIPPFLYSNTHTHLPHEKHSQRTHSTNETNAFHNEPKNEWIWINITYLPLHSLAAHFPSRNRSKCSQVDAIWLFRDQTRDFDQKMAFGDKEAHRIAKLGHSGKLSMWLLFREKLNV